MTSLYVADGQNILEMVPMVPGQYSMDVSGPGAAGH